MSANERRHYVIGLGANLGDRLATFRAALGALSKSGRLVAVSHLYETEPVGPAQPSYFNAAVLLDSALAPEPLLTELLAIERQHGRERRERWGPRTLDLDLLFSPGLVLDTPWLTLPHPQLSVRGFALIPLLDVSPHAHDPQSGLAYSTLASGLSLDGVRRLESAPNWCAAIV